MIRLFTSCRSATDSIPRPLRLRRLFSTSGSRKILTLETINQNVVKMEYAVRGNILTQANEIKSQMKNEAHEWPFEKLTFANIGNPHAMKQQVVSFPRQVLACCSDPELLKKDIYPKDVQQRAREYLDSIEGKSIGAYTDSLGLSRIRQQVADFISRRDGYEARKEDVILINGASEGILILLTLCINPSPLREVERCGFMIPIPQYPLYTAAIAKLGAKKICYYLDYNNEWQLDIQEMRKTLSTARQECHPRVLVVLNPGNPTGQCLPKENIREIIKFARDENLFLIADEVYQENVYSSKCKFYSFKKVLRSMGSEFDNFEMASFHSTSKGYLGECGLRGGYMEVIGLDSQVKEQLVKYFSSHLCPNVPGQVITGTMVKPPVPGDPSYEQYSREIHSIQESLKRKAKLVSKRLNDIPGMSCNAVQGAMYAYPRITVPEKALHHAKEKDMKLDEFYCMKLLEDTGIVLVPGSGFGTEVTCSFHFRTTILPSEDKLEIMLQKLEDFHNQFCKKYSSETL